MNIKRGDLITLSDNNQYLVISKIFYEDKFYLYFIDMNDDKNIKFGFEKQEGDILEIIPFQDPVLINKILPLFEKDLAGML